MAIRLFALFSLIGLIACSSRQHDQMPTGPVQVKIPLMTSEGYKFEIVDLLSVDNLIELKGWAAKFFFSPSVKNGEISGYAPQIRVIKNVSGVFIATDVLSLQLLTVYYHMENLGMMDEIVGAKDVNTWPRKVAVNVNYLSAQDSQHQKNKVENNALYSGELDALLFVPYTQSALPITVNGGIIGHEHFHSLFHKLVVKPLGKNYPDMQSPTLHDETEMRLKVGLPVSDQSQDISKVLDGQSCGRDCYHAFLLRGLNEGLADFWGWLYSQDTDFVGRSLPQFAKVRNLDVSDNVLSESCFKMSLTSADKDPLMSAYEYGSSIARTLKTFTDTYRQGRQLTLPMARAQIGGAIVKALSDLKVYFETLPTEKTMDTVQFLDIFINQISDLKTNEKSLIQKTLDKSRSTDKESRSCLIYTGGLGR